MACPSAAPFNCSCEVKRIVPLSPTGSELMPLVTVNCSARNLTRFPPSLPEFAWELRMEGNHVSFTAFSIYVAVLLFTYDLKFPFWRCRYKVLTCQ